MHPFRRAAQFGVLHTPESQPGSENEQREGEEQPHRRGNHKRNSPSQKARYGLAHFLSKYFRTDETYSQGRVFSAVIDLIFRRRPQKRRTGKKPDLMTAPARRPR